MPYVPPIKVIETKRKPPLWSVKVGARYEASYVGDKARGATINFGKTLGWPYGLVEKPTQAP
jgi:hypothetical protein